MPVSVLDCEYNINVSKLVKRKRIDYKRTLERMIIQTFEIEIAKREKEKERNQMCQIPIIMNG